MGFGLAHLIPALPHQDSCPRLDTHKINSNNQLCFTPAISLNFGGRSSVCRRWEVLSSRRAIASSAGVARRATGNRRAALHGGYLGRVTGYRSTGVNWGRTADHLRGRSACLTYYIRNKKRRVSVSQPRRGDYSLINFFSETAPAGGGGRL